MAGLVEEKGREDVGRLLASDRHHDKEPRPPLHQGQVRPSYPVLRAHDEVTLPVSELPAGTGRLRTLGDWRPSGLSVRVGLPFLLRFEGLSAGKVDGSYPLKEPFPAVGVKRLDADGWPYGLGKGFLIQSVARGGGASGLACDFSDRPDGAAFSRPVHRRHHLHGFLSVQALEPAPLLPYNLFRHGYVLSDV